MKGMVFADAWEFSALCIEAQSCLWQQDTPYQKIWVLETQGWGKVLVLDDVLQLTERDNFIYHEMMVHPALFIHPAPKRVAIAGGGDCGVLTEVLKHAEVEEALLIELDEEVTKVCQRFFPELTACLADPRASCLFGDAIAFMEQSVSGRLDAILVDSTDPIGQAARLFGKDFYRACFEALASPGVLAVQSESPLFHLDLLKSIRKNMREAGFPDVATLSFPQPTYPSGWFSVTLAAKGISLRSLRQGALEKKTFPTRYYCREIHDASFALPAFAAEALI